MYQTTQRRILTLLDAVKVLMRLERATMHAEGDAAAAGRLRDALASIAAAQDIIEGRPAAVA